MTLWEKQQNKKTTTKKPDKRAERRFQKKKDKDKGLSHLYILGINMYVIPIGLRIYEPTTSYQQTTPFHLAEFPRSFIIDININPPTPTHPADHHALTHSAPSYHYPFIFSFNIPPSTNPIFKPPYLLPPNTNLPTHSHYLPPPYPSPNPPQYNTSIFS